MFSCFHARVTLREPTIRAVLYTQRTVIYGVVIVSRNLERTNQNDGFKMTALETVEKIQVWIFTRSGLVTPTSYKPKLPFIYLPNMQHTNNLCDLVKKYLPAGLVHFTSAGFACYLHSN